MARPFRTLPNSQTTLSGVCSGMAYWLGLPTWLIRLAFIVVTWVWGSGLILYILLACILPEWDKKPADYNEVTGD